MTLITITGTYVDVSNTPLSGTVSFTPVATGTDGTVIFLADPVQARVSAGVLSQVLQTTDSWDVEGAVTYKVVERIGTTARRRFYITLPSSLGSTVDIATRLQFDTPPNQIQLDSGGATTDFTTHLTTDHTPINNSLVSLDSRIDALEAVSGVDPDLVEIAALTPVDNDLLQQKAGVWTNRTPAQVKADLALTKSDVGLANVDNTSDATKDVDSATRLATPRTINGVAFDGTANISVPATAGFTMAGNVSGDIAVAELVEGGVSIPIATTLSKVLITVDREPRGANLVISLVKRERTTGTETTIGTATITADVSKRAVLTGLSTPLAVDDRIMFRCTQIGSSQPGSGLEWALFDSVAPTLPTVLAAPAAPTGGSATVTGGNNVTVSWTAPASGTYLGVDVYKDGAWVGRVLKGTNSYVDLDASADSYVYTMYAVNTDATSSGLTVNYTPGSSTIGDPVDLGVAVYGGASTASVLNITVGTAASAGDMVAVLCGGSVPGNAGVTVTVTDSRSNSYTTHVHPYDETHSQQVAIISSKITTGLQVGDTITVTWSVATARLMARAYKVSGIAAASHFDKSASRNVFTANASTSLSTNATATLAQAKEIAFAAYSVQWNAGQSASTGWNLGTITESGATTNNKALIPTWRIVDSTAALTGTGTLGQSAAQSCAIATFKGA